MRREISEVLASQAKMLDRRGEERAPTTSAWRELFEAISGRPLPLKREPHIEALDVHYRQVLEDPVPHARRIAEFLGRDLDIEAMASISRPRALPQPGLRLCGDAGRARLQGPRPTASENRRLQEAGGAMRPILG